MNFEVCVAADPQNQNGHYWFGRSFVMQDDWAAAEKAFSKALKIDPTFENPYSWRSIARAKLGRDREAVADVESSLTMSPDDSVRWRCARAYALCAGQVAGRSQEDAVGEGNLVDQYARRSIELLREMADHGYFEPGTNLVSFLSDDLDALRERTEFRELMESCAAPLIADPSLARSTFEKLVLFEVLLQRAEVAKAGEVAESMVQLGMRLALFDKRRAADLLDAARCFVRCAEATADDQAALQQFRKRALDAISTAVRLGYDNVEQLKSDASLDMIRSEPEFQQIITQLQP